MGVYSRERLVSVLFPVFAKHNIKSATLFGSYAKNMADEHSDVDLMVDSGLRGLAFYGLLEDISEALTVPVDLLDRSQIEPGSPVDKEIQKTGVRIYECA